MNTEKKEDPRVKLKELFEVQHHQWLNHPTTQSFLKAMRAHKDKFVDLLSTNASSSMPDHQFRQFAVNVRNTDAILELAQNTEIFYKQLNPNINEA